MVKELWALPDLVDKFPGRVTKEYIRKSPVILVNDETKRFHEVKEQYGFKPIGEIYKEEESPFILYVYNNNLFSNEYDPPKLRERGMFEDERHAQERNPSPLEMFIGKNGKHFTLEKTYSKDSEVIAKLVGLSPLFFCSWDKYSFAQPNSTIVTTIEQFPHQTFYKNDLLNPFP